MYFLHLFPEEGPWYTHKEHQINFYFVLNLNKFRKGWWHFHWTWRHRISGGRGIIEDVLEWKTFGGREMDEKSILSKSQLKEHRTALWFFSSLISFTCRISLNLSSILPILICCQELFCSKVWDSFLFLLKRRENTVWIGKHCIYTYIVLLAACILSGALLLDFFVCLANLLQYHLSYA